MEKEKTFRELITNYSFIIPDYQRAYSWGEKQLIPFINDILEHCDDNNNPSDDTTYYLGHYILENSKDKSIFEIVDGQQRISTVYLFFIVCGYLKNKNYNYGINFRPVSYDLPGLEEIKDILNQRNDAGSELEKLLKNSKTSSLKRMIEAVNLFLNAFSDAGKLKTSDIENYVKILNNAYCSVAVFDNKSVASQIFELHNTRGVKLTETEKIKALLMKSIYINSTNPDEDIKEIQCDFAKIFELEEQASEVWLRGEMPLDTVLMYHLRATEDGNKFENFGLPQSNEGEKGSFEYVKDALSKKNNKELVVNYAKNLAKEFAKSMEILTNVIPTSDKQNRIVGDVLLLDKNKSIIFLLRAFRVNKNIDSILISRWENFLLNYEMIYWHGFFHNKRYRGDWHEIYKTLVADSDFIATNSILKEFYDGKKRFGSDWKPLAAESKARFETGQKHYHNNAYNFPKVGYFLYKYELSKEANIELIRNSIFKNDKVSIDHIVAQQISLQSLGFENINTLEESHHIRIQANLLLKDINNVINGIGNLALSTVSRNASDSNKLPAEHINTYLTYGFKSTAQQVQAWIEPQFFATKIEERTQDIADFISETIINRNDIWE